jgi:hypothetical protein
MRRGIASGDARRRCWLPVASAAKGEYHGKAYGGYA